MLLSFRRRPNRTEQSLKYDDASWHYGGNFPADLPDEAGATHIAMFVAWALLSGLGGELHEGMAWPLKTRSVTPGRFFRDACDGQLTDEDLSEDGNAFAAVYYLTTADKPATAIDYFADYQDCLMDKVASVYHIADSWANFDKLRPVLDRRWQDWRAGRRLM
jgi:hypothetical protein